MWLLEQELLRKAINKNMNINGATDGQSYLQGFGSGLILIGSILSGPGPESWIFIDRIRINNFWGSFCTLLGSGSGSREICTKILKKTRFKNSMKVVVSYFYKICFSYILVLLLEVKLPYDPSVGRSIGVMVGWSVIISSNSGSSTSILLLVTCLVMIFSASTLNIWTAGLINCHFHCIWRDQNWME